MNRARWQRRWFVLRHIDGRITLEYFKDQAQTKRKGTIILNDCQQVDQGLSFESKRRYQNAHIFDVVTPKRKYYLVTNSERDMQRWVDSICRACGFRSEDETSISDTTSYRVDRESFFSEDNSRTSMDRLHSTTASIRSDPSRSMREGTRESYIPLTNCETPGENELSQSLPRDLEAEYLQRGSMGTSSSDSSSSSLHDPVSMSAPAVGMRTVPPNTDQVYDVPPVKPSLLQSIYENHRTSVRDPTSTQFERQMSKEEASRDIREEVETRRIPPAGPQMNYDVVPPPRQPIAPLESDSVYDVPPVPHYKMPEVPERTYQSSQLSSIYDVPSSTPNDDTIYDIPPGPMPKEAPPSLSDSFITKPLPQSNSTDELAKSLTQISMRNAERNSVEVQGTEQIYDVPPGLRNENGNPFSSSGKSISSPQNAPPRPPKPPGLEGAPLNGSGPVNPPANFADDGFDDTYVGSPGVNDSPPISNGHVTSLPAPQGHHWLENRVPTPRKYLNVRDGPSSKPPVSTTLPIQSPTGYLPMQGANSSPNVFEYPDENYMPMEGTFVPMEKNPDLYTAMDGTQPPPLPRESTSSVFTDDTPPPVERREDLPPPVDRSSKPGRLKTGSSVTSTGSIKLPMQASEYHGQNESYYATEADIGIPVRNSRTKSFSRDGRLRSTGNNSPRGTPPMRRNNTVQHPMGVKPLPHQPPTLLDYPVNNDDMSEDTYMLHEQSLFSESTSPDLLSNSFSSSPKVKDKIEYLEIAHDEDSAKSPPPARPPKAQDVEYITIDKEKTKALETTQQNREKSYKGS